MANGSTITLIAPDGHRLDAYVASPPGRPKGGLVILQEIFGVNRHMESVGDEYAAAGYLCVVPAVFDRLQKNLTFPYSDIQPGRDAVAKLAEPDLLADLSAATTAAAEGGAVAHMGFCWGGSVAYLAACKVGGIVGAVNYYGTRTIQLCETMTPRVPVQYHFGALDKTIPPEGIAKIKAADPKGTFFVYDNADHGFACNERAMFNAGAKRLARERTVMFLDKLKR